jgi:hypothetical protein
MESQKLATANYDMDQEFAGGTTKDSSKMDVQQQRNFEEGNEKKQI